MTLTQDIFKGFGRNWKWASHDGSGLARVHTGKAVVAHDGSITETKWGGQAAVRAEVFDAVDLSPDVHENATVFHRTDFSNGPAYETDQFGIPLPVVEVPTGSYAPPPPELTPPGPTMLTTDEAEAGGLWDFARADENYVSVNLFGTVWFDLFEGGPKPRRSFDVEVTSVTHVIERTRSQPQLAPPEAGKPFTPPEAEKAYDSPGLSDAEARPSIEQLEHDGHGWADGVAELEKKLNPQRRVLQKAKARAHALLSCYYVDGSQQLTTLQYMAIFGEQPE